MIQKSVRGDNFYGGSTDMRKRRFEFARKFAEKENITFKEALTSNKFKKQWTEYKNEHSPKSEKVPDKDQDDELEINNITVKLQKKKGGHRTHCKTCNRVLKGGAKLPASLLKEINIQSGKEKNWAIPGFITDNKLSSPRFQVYVKHPSKDEDGIVISYVRGTKTKTDVIVDMGLAVNYRGDRFKLAKRAQERVVKKYGSDPPKYYLFIIGSSLGGSISEWLGNHENLRKGFIKSDIITIGKPVTPAQLVSEKLGNTTMSENQTDVRQEYDPVSSLKPFQKKGKTDIQLDSEHGMFHPIKNHIGESVMSHPDIKDEMIGTSRRLPVADLRKAIIMLRKHDRKKGGAKINITGLKKPQLQAKFKEMVEKNENVSDKGFLETMKYIQQVHDAKKKNPEIRSF